MSYLATAVAVGTTFSAPGTGPEIFVQGGVNISLGAFEGGVKLQRQDSTGAWMDVARDSAGTPLAWTSGGFALAWAEQGMRGAFYRLVCTSLTSGIPYCELST